MPFTADCVPSCEGLHVAGAACEYGENRYAHMLDFEAMMFVIEPPGNCKDGDRFCVEVR